jgi:hypothetical protein
MRGVEQSGSDSGTCPITYYRTRPIDEKPLWMLTGHDWMLRLCESGHSSVTSGQNLTHVREVSWLLEMNE